MAVIPNERLWDDSIFLRPGEARPEPRSLGSLRVRLGLCGQDDATCRAGVAEWLKTNEPSESLVDSMKRRGYGDLLS